MISEEVKPTQKKKKKAIPEPSSLSFSSLPDEIIENILARVPRCNYLRLSLVSKTFHSLLSSMEIYKTRSQIGANEACVYVCLQLPGQPCASWFSLWTKPNQNRTKRREKIGFKRDSSGNSVVPTPLSYSNSLPEQRYIETVGPEIYIIGGPEDEKPYSSVRTLDCRSHTWRDGPNMTVAREYAHTVLLDEKIYVMGGCDIDEYSANWIEVFDMKAQSWTALSGPGADVDELLTHLRNFDSFYIVDVVKGKFYLAADKKVYTYDPKDGTWKLVRDKSSFLPNSVSAWCKMENLIYSCTDSGYLMWSGSETEGIEWREIKGLEKLREHPTRGLRTGTTRNGSV